MTSPAPGAAPRRGDPRPPPRFLDAASGEPLHEAARMVLATLLGWPDADSADPSVWVDPNRRYGAARRAQILLNQARETVAEHLGCRADELSFTSSGTQAVHLAVLGSIAGRRRVGDLVVSSAVEHSSVLQALEHHRAGGGRLRLVGVDSLGRLDLAGWAEAIGADGVAAACLQTANHEVGTCQPVEGAAELCARAGVPLVVDAAQSVGRHAPVPPGWSVLTASAHKWGGPAGIGVLAVRPSARWRAPWPRDDRGAVPGFPAVALAVAAAAALEAQVATAEAEDARLRLQVDRLRHQIVERVPDCRVLGDATDRLPHVVTLSLLYADGEALLDQLDRLGFALSSGSSCTSSTLEPSHVLVAMGALTQGNLRVSLPRGVREEDVTALLDALPGVVAGVRDNLGATGL